MRTLTLTEIGFVGGAGDTTNDVSIGDGGDAGDAGGAISTATCGNSSIGDQSGFFGDYTALYEGLIASVVYTAERMMGSSP